MNEADTVPPPIEVEERARDILTQHWRPEGYCVPHPGVYPFQWLWDSCFHAVVWAHLGEADRAVAELEHLFRNQDEVGFVPHVDYEAQPALHAAFWGREGASSITQPPMYGHAVAVLVALGVDVPDRLFERARRGLWFLLRHRARDRASGLVTVVHPWETGADDSPRWDDWCTNRFDLGEWYELKGRLLSTVERAPSGAPLANPAFSVAPAGFNALVAFNASELAEAIDDAALRSAAEELGDALAARWDDDLSTWVDAGPSAAGSGRTRTVDAMLPVLLERSRRVVTAAALADEAAFGGRYGPAGVHRREPTFDPSTYWRGSSWPQLTYLLWLAADRAGDSALAATLATGLVTGAWRSGFAEHWNPDDAAPLGARPQSWSTLAAVVSRRRSAR
jgi:glucosylglycerate hydrolase